MLPPAGMSEPKVTLCRCPLNCQVTVVPATMVRTRGVNVEFGVVTVAPLAVTAVTVTAAVGRGSWPEMIYISMLLRSMSWPH